MLLRCRPLLARAVPSGCGTLQAQSGRPHVLGWRRPSPVRLMSQDTSSLPSLPENGYIADVSRVLMKGMMVTQGTALVVVPLAYQSLLSTSGPPVLLAAGVVIWILHAGSSIRRLFDDPSDVNRAKRGFYLHSVQNGIYLWVLLNILSSASELVGNVRFGK